MLKRPCSGSNKLSAISKSEETAVTPEQTIEEVRRCIQVAGGDRQWDDTRERWLWRAAKRLGLEPGRVTTLFYRKAKSIPAHEYLTIQARARALQKQHEERRRYVQETQELAKASGSTAAILLGDAAGAAFALAEWAEGLKREEG